MRGSSVRYKIENGLMIPPIRVRLLFARGLDRPSIRQALPSGGTLAQAALARLGSFACDRGKLLRVFGDAMVLDAENGAGPNELNEPLG